MKNEKVAFSFHFFLLGQKSSCFSVFSLPPLGDANLIQLVSQVAFTCWHPPLYKTKDFYSSQLLFFIGSINHTTEEGNLISSYSKKKQFIGKEIAFSVAPSVSTMGNGKQPLLTSCHLEVGMSWLSHLFKAISWLWTGLFELWWKGGKTPLEIAAP